MCWYVYCRWGGQVTLDRRSLSLTNWQRRHVPSTESMLPLSTLIYLTRTSRASLRPSERLKVACWCGNPPQESTRAMDLLVSIVVSIVNTVWRLSHCCELNSTVFQHAYDAGTGSEPVLEMLWWKRGLSCAMLFTYRDGKLTCEWLQNTFVCTDLLETLEIC